MRPVYETAKDRGKEFDVLITAAAAWGSEFAGTKALSPCDYVMLKDGEVKALVEIKCRNNPMSKYPDYMISHEKVGKIQAAAQVMGCKPLLIVRFSDCIGWVDLSKTLGKVSFGGRKDRGDSADMEPCLFIPINQFSNIRS
jgi:hypothetical protein